MMSSLFIIRADTGKLQVQLCESDSSWLESYFKVCKHADIYDRCGSTWRGSSWMLSSRTPPKTAWHWMQGDLDHCPNLMSDGLSKQKTSRTKSKHPVLTQTYGSLKTASFKCFIQQFETYWSASNPLIWKAMASIHSFFYLTHDQVLGMEHKH